MKILSVAILLFISFQVCGQEYITIDISKKKVRYYYEGKRAQPIKLREIIYNSDDALAVNNFPIIGQKLQ